MSEMQGEGLLFAKMELVFLCDMLKDQMNSLLFAKMELVFLCDMLKDQMNSCHILFLQDKCFADVKIAP
ncbi:MAG: hypothetical protein ACKPJF_10835 [Dolichospermum sp.]